MNERNQNKQFIKEKIYIMFQRVYKTIHNLIDYLNSIYKENGINYPIVHLQTVITRILTPHQLLTEYGINDNSQLIMDAHYLPQFVARAQQNTQNFQQKTMLEKQNTFKFPSHNIINNYSRIQQPNITHYPVKFNENFRNQKAFESQFQKGKRGGRPRALTNQMQKQLATWVMNQVSKGQQISRKNVTKLACQLLNDPNFQGSDGWYSNFIKRNPSIKQLIIRRKKNSEKNQIEVPHKNINYYPMQNIINSRRQKFKVRFPDKMRKENSDSNQNIQQSNLYLEQEDSQNSQDIDKKQMSNQSDLQQSLNQNQEKGQQQDKGSYKLKKQDKSQ